VTVAIQLILGRTPKFFVPFLREVSYFVDSIRDDVQPMPSGDDALKDLEVIAKAYASQTPLQF